MNLYYFRLSLKGIKLVSKPKRLQMFAVWKIYFNKLMLNLKLSNNINLLISTY